MKARASAAIIRAYAKGVEAAVAVRLAASLRSFARFLDDYAEESVEDVCTHSALLSAAAQQIGSGHDHSAHEVALQLELLKAILVTSSAKKSCIEDLASLARLLRSFRESDSLEAVVARLRDDMRPNPIDHQISTFIQRLNRDTGTDSFEQTLAELADSPLQREHVVAVAKSVYGGIRNSTSRKAALEFVRKPHDARMSARRGIEATGGRSAA